MTTWKTNPKDPARIVPPPTSMLWPMNRSSLSADKGLGCAISCEGPNRQEVSVGHPAGWTYRRCLAAAWICVRHRLAGTTPFRGPDRLLEWNGLQCTAGCGQRGHYCRTDDEAADP